MKKYVKLKARSLRDLFGSDGEKAVEVARLINSSRRVEVEEEIRS